MLAILLGGWGTTLTRQMGWPSLPYLPISCLFLRILRALLLLTILLILLPLLIRRPPLRPRPHRNQAGVFRFEQQRSEKHTSEPQQPHHVDCRLQPAKKTWLLIELRAPAAMLFRHTPDETTRHPQL